MSYSDKVKIRSVPKTKLVDVLSGMTDIQLIKYHRTHIKHNVIPVRYKGLSFEFIMSQDGFWELWYQSLFHTRVLTTENIVVCFNNIICAWDQYECNLTVNR